MPVLQETGFHGLLSPLSLQGSSIRNLQDLPRGLEVKVPIRWNSLKAHELKDCELCMLLARCAILAKVDIYYPKLRCCIRPILTTLSKPTLDSSEHKVLCGEAEDSFTEQHAQEQFHIEKWRVLFYEVVHRPEPVPLGKDRVRPHTFGTWIIEAVEASSESCALSLAAGSRYDIRKIGP